MAEDVAQAQISRESLMLVLEDWHAQGGWRLDIGFLGTAARASVVCELAEEDAYAIDGSVLSAPDGALYFLYTTGSLRIAPMSSPCRVSEPGVTIALALE